MKFKKKPDIGDRKVEDKEDLVKDFLSKADQPATFTLKEEVVRGSPTSDIKTWRDVTVKKDITTFSFRIPKKDMQQLKFVSQQTGLSLNALCLMAIQANNRKMLKDLEDDL